MTNEIAVWGANILQLFWL